MKNNLAFKFIAVILCAASLLGILGGALGVLVLTEGDLYNKTVPQVRRERLAQYAEIYTDTLAQMYACSNLGGCPDAFVSERYDSWFASEYSTYGYRILDAEGNVLSSYREDLSAAPGITPFTVTPTGQYMHLVDVESELERLAREQKQERQQQLETLIASSSTVPIEGILIDHVVFLHQDGWVLYEASVHDRSLISSDYFDSLGNGCGFNQNGRHTGMLFRTPDGNVIYESYLDEPEAEAVLGIGECPVGAIHFSNYEEDYTYTVSDYENGVGSISINNGLMRFVSNFTVADTANEPMAVEESVPPETSGWVAETIPGNDRYIQIITPDGTVLEVPLPTEEEPTEATEITEAVESTEASETVAATAEVTAPTEETTVEETVEESVPSSASAIPEETEVIQFTIPSETVEITVIPETTEATESTEAWEATIPAIVRTLPSETVPEETVPEETEPVLINGKPLEEYQVNSWEYWDSKAQEPMTARYVYLPMPELTVELYVDESSVTDAAMYDLMELVRSVRNYLLPLIGICLFLFAVFAVYLCTAAGRRPKTDEVRAGGLNRLPLDLYFCLGCFGIACLAAICVEGTETLMRRDFLVGCGFAVAAAFAACLIFVGFCFAFVAQLKTPGGFWWRNTFCGHCIRLIAKFAVWLENGLAHKGFPLLGRFFRFLFRLCKSLWQLTCRFALWCFHTLETALLWLGKLLGRISRWIGHKLKRFFSLLPLTWQWLLIGLVILMISMICISYGDPNLTVFGVLLILGIILYISHCFGTLAESAKRMSKGDLDTKVDDMLLVGCFDDFATDLNNLAGVAVIAAQKQLKSERMKTELITNVSHDIKTPLTSIINYVDLLQKPHTEEEQQQYLEVLDRQSQRLKKLIDDLMDMSKANTGNMQVDITQVDAIESVNQALGEFADKLDKARLIPVFRHDESQMPMMADGRLVWRVLSNLLSNAVKYAMPGTRLYIDLMSLEGKVVISLKNISREELNIDADELMERFVRGDDSRNTEGSGLGLNIAKSLMELQKGQLQILVDGDLFKVTLIFPGI